VGPFFRPHEHAGDEARIPAHFLLVGEVVEERAPQMQQ
jgi:hypothetical protein